MNSKRGGLCGFLRLLVLSFPLVSPEGSIILTSKQISTFSKEASDREQCHNGDGHNTARCFGFDGNTGSVENAHSITFPHL